MRRYSNPSDILPNPKRANPNFNLTHTIINHFTLENCIITLGTGKVDVANVFQTRDSFYWVRSDVVWNKASSTLPIPVLDLVEQHYSTPFTIYKIPLELYQHLASSVINEYLSLPLFSVIYPEIHSMVFLQEGRTSRTPAQIVNSTALQIWSLPYRMVHTPIVNIRCELKTSNFILDVSWNGKKYLGSFATSSQK